MRSINGLARDETAEPRDQLLRRERGQGENEHLVCDECSTPYGSTTRLPQAVSMSETRLGLALYLSLRHPKIWHDREPLSTKFSVVHYDWRSSCTTPRVSVSRSFLGCSTPLKRINATPRPTFIVPYALGRNLLEPMSAETRGAHRTKKLWIYLRSRSAIIITPVLSTCLLHTNSGCGKERRILIGPW